MREQGDATGFPSIALPYGFGLPPDKRQAALPAVATPLAAVLACLKIPPPVFAAARRAAQRNRTDAGAELAASAIASEEDIAQAIAECLGLDRAFAFNRPFRLVGGENASPRLRRAVTADGRPVALIAPRLEEIDALDGLILGNPALGPMLRIATPAELARLAEAETAPARLDAACLSLSRDRPSLSARETLTGRQGMVAALLLAALVLFAVHAPTAGLLVAHLLMLPVFFGCVALRVLALVDIMRGTGRDAPSHAVTLPTVHPRYTILVALRGENEDSITSLVEALDAMRWPRAKLQVLMICEADDHTTLAAVARSIHGLPGFSLVSVPPARPRTKPKALNFALPLATGEFVALFDAEDRPHPDQLLQAWTAFRSGGARLACVQAPLVVTNGRRGWLPAHFAVEYRVLFTAFLPFLARRGMPLPLGGTSNHFRREALLEVGAWDSHNVTEDADLGIRLARHGFRAGTITAPTFEEAPERWPDWLKQRTRWMKGWMQSYLVHMRDPARTRAEFGTRDFLVFQLLFAGMIASSIAHTTALPFLALTVLMLATTAEPFGIEAFLFAFDVLAMVAGYATFAALALATATRRRATLRHLWTLPFYWFAIGLATLRALHQLTRDPHLWEKTPHGVAARKPASAGPARRTLWNALRNCTPVPALPKARTGVNG